MKLPAPVESQITPSETGRVVPQPLRAYLSHLKISQRQLSRAAGISPATVCRILAGESLPSPAAASAIANLVKLPEGLLFRDGRGTGRRGRPRRAR
jgi:transcriptional regulator with XRE-family HTH domain